ncbi:hypothetical protein ABB37_02038 [Leptomonas pyrrhocoris]|uniref:Uncharacterized protein n=1 Tax=Leptomonas pyrrhocoris TaxID=157538 RepID=A0A0N0DY79_LEPPY|nr:hypothetical protein ABB37_02038 [Leptomonas pyrrhocoris]XP_015662274.1 hypothetical protein ABB37_02038 [Leptomonas pyrrhocoris]KPA83834.1 hypothetical protein ABB37_02038 [Leptomonas pyrrhocoris]KPA83835.1 hypothetical protein ABB37_02038 [Leptomonas pyrrhocoris]|eukprot:XP_015662273.1 hypothetical protein ABB37_02038 [Leptomonas pyrrhocoris]
MPSFPTPALLLASCLLCFSSIFACAYLLVALMASCRTANIVRHIAVAVTLVPVAFVLCLFLVFSYNSLGETLHTFAKEHQSDLPPPIVYAAAAVRPLSGHFNLTETMWMACLLFTAYGVAIVWHHLIDITRLLKASRRRLLLSDMQEQRTEEAAAPKAGKKR